MKTRCLIGFAVLLAVGACNRPNDNPVETRHGTLRIEQVVEPVAAERSRSIETPSKQVPEPVEGPSQELSAIDSLMWHQPDSALAHLIPYFDTCTTTEYNRHYANLLLSELLYKNDYAQTNRSALSQAVTYFDSIMQVPEPAVPKANRRVEGPSKNQIAFLDARTHYINGVGYYENDSAVKACKEYMKALEMMENHFKEKELIGHKAQFMALTYTRLTDIFSDLYLHEQAIYFAQNSLSFYQKQDAPSWHLARMLSEIGIHYDMMNQLDSAKYYYQNAAKLLNDTDGLIFRDILTHQAYLEYEIGQQADSTINALTHILAEAKTQDEYLARAAIIGEVFYHEKQYDSAWGYLKMVFEKSSRNDSKKQSAEWLKTICDIQGRDSEKYEYANFLVPFANQEENTSAIKSQLTELYNTFRQNILKRQHRQIIQKNMTRIIAVMCGLLIVMLFITLLYHQNRRKLLYLESVKTKEKEASSKAWDQYVAFMEESICQHILRSIQGENIKRSATPKAYPNLVLNDGELQQLAIAVNRYFDPFEHQLELHGLKASPIIVNLCHLYLLGIDEKQAAILLNRDYSSISRYEKKLKTAFKTQDNLTLYFRDLVLSK